MFYIGGCNCVLCQFIELVTFARFAFIFALWNITGGGYLDTRRNIHFRTFMARCTACNIYIAKFGPLNALESSLHLQLFLQDVNLV